MRKFTMVLLGVVFMVCGLGLSVATADWIPDGTTGFITYAEGNKKFAPYVYRLMLGNCVTDQEYLYDENARIQRGGKYRRISCSSMAEGKLWFILTTGGGGMVTKMFRQERNKNYSVRMDEVVHYDLRSNLWLRDDLGINKAEKRPTTQEEIDEEFAKSANQPPQKPDDTSKKIGDAIGKGLGGVFKDILKAR